ncbi:hypothetical protein F5Y09DRAFT_333266 [Xylaria sp. FL1042]|nr:hypothetical protein F5Y09DRAFT_333266 [Xylaria sp. FL1042]
MHLRVTELGIAIIDAQGSTITTSTARVAIFSSQKEGEFGSFENPIITVGGTTLTDAIGLPVATLTLSPNPISISATATVVNPAGQLLHASVWSTLITHSLSIETDSLGSPTRTIASYPTPPATKTIVYYISLGEYFVGMFLPTILASIIAILVRALSTNAKIFQPWQALTNDHGALGHNSLCLHTSVVIFFTNILLFLSAVLVPLSAETITLDLRGDGCKTGTKNYAWVLSASAPASKAAIALLALMSILAILLLVLLKRWRLGVYINPRSIYTLASLSLNDKVRQLVMGTDNPLTKRNGDLIECQTFKLGHFQRIRGRREYENNEADTLNTHSSNNPPKSQQFMPFFILRHFGRLSLLFVVSGVLGLVLYYSQTSDNTGFKRFLDGDSFGVRFLFTGFGVIISFLWSSFLDSVAIISPYQLLAAGPKSASRSILSASPTNPFSGLLYAACTRHIFLALVALASSLSEFLGIFLSNIPFHITQLYLVFKVSLWVVVGVLSFMTIVLLMSFFVKWPHMPADPRTIAGAMYYVCDSPMLHNFEGLSTLERKERDQRVTESTLQYKFSVVKGISGEFRTIVKTSKTNSLMS